MNQIEMLDILMGDDTALIDFCRKTSLKVLHVKAMEDTVNVLLSDYEYYSLDAIRKGLKDDLNN